MTTTTTTVYDGDDGGFLGWEGTKDVDNDGKRRISVKRNAMKERFSFSLTIKSVFICTGRASWSWFLFGMVKKAARIFRGGNVLPCCGEYELQVWPVDL